jgi:hypothetical protein
MLVVDCAPIGSEKCRFLLSAEGVLCKGWDSERSCRSRADRRSYSGGGYTLRKGNETTGSSIVPEVSRSNSFEVSSLSPNAPMVEKRNALRPKAARGKAVAVPLERG